MKLPKADAAGTHLNCAQTVAQYLLDQRKEQSPPLMKALRSFGVGLSCGHLCGCLAGGAAAISLLVPDGPEGKRLASRLTRELVAWFEEEFGSTECRVLKSPGKGIPCSKLETATAQKCTLLLQDVGL